MLSYNCSILAKNNNYIIYKKEVISMEKFAAFCIALLLIIKIFQIYYSLYLGPYMEEKMNQKEKKKRVEK
jgi:hypothetical protein